MLEVGSINYGFSEGCHEQNLICKNRETNIESYSQKFSTLVVVK